jgi:hypothetical protein
MEQPISRNLSATATRVLQCTCPAAASRKDFSAIHTSTSPHLTLAFINNIILHLFLVLCTAVDVRIKINVSTVLLTFFTIWHKCRPLGISKVWLNSQT